MSRNKNIVWTISEDYSDVNTNSFLSETPYKLALLGISHKLYNKFAIEKFLSFHINSKTNYKDLKMIMALAIENATREKLFEFRPGTVDFFEEFLKSLKHKYEFLEPTSISEELERAYYSSFLNKPRIVNGSLEEMLNEIENFHSLGTYELLNFLKNLYQKYFHVYDTMPTTDKVEKFIEKVKSKQIINPMVVNVKEVEISDLEKFNIESAEFTQSIYEDLKEVIDKSNIKSGAKDYSAIVERRYGKSIGRPNEIKKLESEICTGIHENVKLHFTNGEYTMKDSFFKAQADEVHTKNLEKYRADELHFKRATINLKEVLKNSILKNSEQYNIRSTMGELVASEIWKSLYSNNQKVFKRNYSDDLGDISVDILLDSSASQTVRQSEVAIEAFIIAEALTSLNIDTRVISFNNFFDRMIIKTYRDYHDSKLKNSEIFKFQGSGSNRDGLAIKLITNLIEKNPHDRKFLIILSDGKPNDETDLGLIGMADLGVENYVDEIATFDTYNSVMKARLMGINVLGVFTGLEEDLETEKKIFGSDFAYITDLKRFHSIVGIFFKAIANKIN
ncbi:hypothetical protein [Peptoniphilus indolicus]|uniref:VWFA domain-containing protein n=2 Tax=Peptoniphilus indolicus TaxID=33030 RepID=G4D4X7_9FIRM|nr:hypothetical protein [Peptoniphilus indolicus]EGY79425.1 hypothetical protein HMPREF9129_1457 [Peptoniphilus indolicus ATCC 29427]SUB74595.1 Nitric oxide reductase activation protein [Peptoniphilus indolicus]